MRFSRIPPIDLGISVGSPPDGAGIYQCQECGYEDVINRECNTLPPCQSPTCQEKRKQGQRWKLVREVKDSW